MRTWMGLIIAAAATAAHGGAEQDLDRLIPGLASVDMAERYESQMRAQALAAAATRPDAGAEREAMERAMAARVADETTPKHARVWLARQLEFLGGAASVPALAGLLGHADAELRETARRALELNPSPAAGAALAAALDRPGDTAWRMGLINSLGVRRDAGATPALARCLSTPELRPAAAAALGKIGGGAAISALEKVWTETDADVGAALVEAAMAAGRAGLPVLDRVLSSGAPPAIRAAALTAAVGADGPTPASLRRLIDAMASPHREMHTAAILAAAPLRGATLSAAIKSAWDRLPAAAKIGAMGLLDAAGREVVAASLDSSDADLAAAAAKALAALGGPDTVPLLLRAAAEGAARPAAESALAALPGADASAALRSAAADGSPTRRAAAMSALALRRDRAAIPIFLAAIVNTDPVVARAAGQALRTAGGDTEIEPLARTAASGSAEAAAALKVLAARAANREAAGQTLARIADTVDAKGKMILLDMLPVAGGTAALDHVRRHLDSGDAATQTAAIRALSAWADFSAAESLRAIIEAPASTDTQRTLAARGLARLAGACADAPADRRVEAAIFVLEKSGRPDERKAAIAALGNIPHARAAEALQQLLAGGDLRDEAAFALASLAAAYRDKDRATARRIADAVAKSAAPDAAKKKAAEAVR